MKYTFILSVTSIVWLPRLLNWKDDGFPAVVKDSLVWRYLQNKTKVRLCRLSNYPSWGKKGWMWWEEKEWPSCMKSWLEHPTPYFNVLRLQCVRTCVGLMKNKDQKRSVLNKKQQHTWDMRYTWNDGSATSPINREKRKSHLVLFIVSVQYHASSTVRTTVIPVLKAFTLNRLNIKRDLWQHISALDVITAVNFCTICLMWLV